MIYITGDTHRDFERIYDFCQEVGATQEDILIILGDATINYYLNSDDKILKEELSEYPITFLFIHGNHEERPYMIDTYEEIEWNGGIAYIEEEYPNLIFAKDGEVYDLDGAKAMAIGGAYSVDKFSRDIWFDTEQPDDIIKEHVESQLDKLDWKIDYIFSHTAPYKYEPQEAFLPNIDQKNVEKSTERWLDEIEDKLDYSRWFLGHYHIDTRIDRVTVMYHEFEELY